MIDVTFMRLTFLKPIKQSFGILRANKTTNRHSLMPETYILIPKGNLIIHVPFLRFWVRETTGAKANMI